MTEESKKAPKLLEQLTDALIKLLVAGSGGFSLYFLFTDSIPKALIAGAIATAAGLLNGLLSKLRTYALLINFGLNIVMDALAFLSKRKSI